MSECTYEIRDGAAWMTFNRPRVLNSLTPVMVDEIAAGLDRARADPSVHVLVFTGAGRAFCAGADLVAAPAMTDESVRSFLERLGHLFDEIESFPKPVIAAVNGVAVAGGLELVLCCDLVVAADEATLGDGHANYGLLPGGGCTMRLPRKAGVSMAKYLLFTGEALPALELQACGLVTQVVPSGRLAEAVDTLTASLAAKSPLGLARIKQLVNDGMEQPLATGLRAERQAAELHSHSADHREGLTAFTEKRAPRFGGHGSFA